MKKALFFSIVVASICLFLNGCSKAPKFPDTPQIEYKSVTKYPAGDSLVLTINFKDGDGDLGLEADFLSSPYHEFAYEMDELNYIEKGSSQAASFPYNCKNYKEGQYDNDSALDTVLITSNLYYNNYIVVILVKQPNGTYEEFDLSNFCPDFNQRFPLLNPRDNKGPIEGTLSHTIKNLFSAPQISGKTIKFQIYIIDRALHKSNLIETPDIVMN